MPTPSQIAQKCFLENLPQLSTTVPRLNRSDAWLQRVAADTALEHWNLYNGLANLAEAVGQLEQKLVALQADLARLRRG